MLSALYRDIYGRLELYASKRAYSCNKTLKVVGETTTVRAYTVFFGDKLIGESPTWDCFSLIDLAWRPFQAQRLPIHCP
jgi:hypothetical protein